jgi:hypothetical protein
MDVFPPVAIFRTGTGNISELVAPSSDRAFKLVYLRCHFTGAVALADMTIALDSAAGEEYDVALFVVRQRGSGADVNLVVTAQERVDPSPWSFQVGDKLRITWPNTLGAVWGLEVGLEIV